MSNSLSAVNSNVAKSGKTTDINMEEVQQLHIKALNKLLTSEDGDCDEYQFIETNKNIYEEMKDTWYTKEEIKQQASTK